jgi:hypothetical protein
VTLGDRESAGAVLAVRNRQGGGHSRVLDELAPPACHHTEPYAHNRREADHGQRRRRLRPRRGLTTDRATTVVFAGHAFIQDIRRGHDELGTEEPVNVRVKAAFAELAVAI